MSSLLLSLLSTPSSLRLANSCSNAAFCSSSALFAEIVLRQQMHSYEREDAHLQLRTGLLEQGPPSCELDQDQCQDLKEESAFIDWNAWSPVFKRALEREEGDQSGSSCVICFSSLSQNTEHGIALLSCTRRASPFSWSTSPFSCGSRAADTIPFSCRSPR